MNPQSPTHRDSIPRPRKLLFAAIVGVLLLGFAEAASRVFLVVKYHARMGEPASALNHFYPEVAAAKRVAPAAAEEFRVLLLGASVLDQVARPLTAALHQRLGDGVSVTNLAVAAHTSLDSWYKYRAMEGYAYDMVVFCHAINEVRANNCSAPAYRDDYSHYAWYDTINLFERNRGQKLLSLPITLSLVAKQLKQKLGGTAYLPRHIPRPESLDFGSDIKTVAAFRRNLESILDLAAERHERVVVTTFAYYVPADYTYERFMDKKLDYADYELPIEIWGKPKNVVAGIAAHNQVIRDVCGQHRDDAILVDQVALIPDDGALFIDICHLSAVGLDRFVDNLLSEVAGRIPRLSHASVSPASADESGGADRR